MHVVVPYTKAHYIQVCKYVLQRAKIKITASNNGDYYVLLGLVLKLHVGTRFTNLAQPKKARDNVHLKSSDLFIKREIIFSIDYNPF